MSEKIKAYQVKSLGCPVCEAIFHGLTPVSTNSPKGLRKGHITVCTLCHTVLQLGSENFKKMTKRELRALDDASKRTLNITINGLRRMESNKVEDN